MREPRETPFFLEGFQHVGGVKTPTRDRLPDPRHMLSWEVHGLRKHFLSPSHWAAYLSLLDGIERLVLLRAGGDDPDAVEFYRVWALRALERVFRYLKGTEGDHEIIPTPLRPATIVTCAELLLNEVGAVRPRGSALCEIEAVAPELGAVA